MSVIRMELLYNGISKNKHIIYFQYEVKFKYGKYQKRR